MNRVYACIDLKSFYASVECMERGLDPLSTNLVVADTSRTEKTVCLAITPSLKQYGLSGRARLFEVIKKVNDINYKRRKKNNYKKRSLNENCYIGNNCILRYYFYTRTRAFYYGKTCQNNGTRIFDRNGSAPFWI